jgi:release factor glutamine methyltransferase
LRIARKNLCNLSLDGRVSYLCGDWASALAGTFDLIVSNPPYIATNELALLSPEVREHDPRLALEAGADGLDAYRAILPQLRERLGIEGTAVLELGQGQEAEVAALAMATGGLRVVGPARPDLAGIPRALVIHVKR